ncbi:hypothetical protein COSO111634_08945 [Corallococcus soli]
MARAPVEKRESVTPTVVASVCRGAGDQPRAACPRGPYWKGTASRAAASRPPLAEKPALPDSDRPRPSHTVSAASVVSEDRKNTLSVPSGRGWMGTSTAVSPGMGSPPSGSSRLPPRGRLVKRFTWPSTNSWVPCRVRPRWGRQSASRRPTCCTSVRGSVVASRKEMRGAYSTWATALPSSNLRPSVGTRSMSPATGGTSGPVACASMERTRVSTRAWTA